MIKVQFFDHNQGTFYFCLGRFLFLFSLSIKPTPPKDQTFIEINNWTTFHLSTSKTFKTRLLLGYHHTLRPIPKIINLSSLTRVHPSLTTITTGSQNSISGDVTHNFAHFRLFDRHTQTPITLNISSQLITCFLSFEHFLKGSLGHFHSPSHSPSHSTLLNSSLL